MAETPDNEDPELFVHFQGSPGHPPMSVEKDGTVTMRFTVERDYVNAVLPLLNEIGLRFLIDVSLPPAIVDSYDMSEFAEFKKGLEDA